MKVYIICSVPAEIPYLGKFFSWDRAKMFSVNHIAGFLKLSPEQVDQKFIGWTWSKMSVTNLVLEL